MRSNENIIVHHHFLGLHLGMETPQYFFGVNAGRFMVFLPSVDAQEGNVSATPNVRGKGRGAGLPAERPT